MITADLYSRKINELLRSPINLERQLTSVIEQYALKVNCIKELVLLSEHNEFSKLHKLASSFKERIDNFSSRLSINKAKISAISLAASTMYNHLKIPINECKNIEKQIGVANLRERLLYLESTILGARVVKNNRMLVKSINEYCSFISSKILLNNEYTQFILEQSDIHETCLNSLDFLKTEFDNCLKRCMFPITITEVTENGDTRTWCDDDLEEFSKFYELFASLDATHLNMILSKPVLETVPVPVQAILNPLEKRFRYHFYGTRETNRIDKPEWYMTQVLQWIRVNDYFVTVAGRDFLSRDGKYSNLRVEFIRGLVTLLLDKLNTDLKLYCTQSMRFELNFQLKVVNQSDDQAFDKSASSLFDDTEDCELLRNAEYFGHLVDVVLRTDARLTQLAYPFDQPRPSDVLTHPKVFARWLLLEQRLASERLANLLLNPISWTVVDESQKRSQCVDDFIALNFALSQRGRQLPDKVSRARFLQVQLNLIYELFQLLVQCAHSEVQAVETLDDQEKKPKQLFKLDGAHTIRFQSIFGGRNRTPLTMPVNLKSYSLARILTNLLETPSIHQHSSRWIGAVNSLKHVQDIMLEWSNDQYYVAFWEDSSTRALLEIGDPWLNDIGLINKLERNRSDGKFPNQAVGQNGSAHKFVDGHPSQFKSSGLHGGVFSQLLDVYSNEIDKMVNETVHSILSDLFAKAQNYVLAKDHWLQSNSSFGYLGKSNIEMNVSSMATGFLIAVRDWLFYLSSKLHPKLFTCSWQLIASLLDNYLYKELILSNRFSTSGAAQLRFDLTRCLYPLFQLHTDYPETFFPLTKDACILLNLLNGTSLLLKDTLEQAAANSTNSLAPLLELGIYNLTAEEALRILNLRDLLPGI